LVQPIQLKTTLYEGIARSGIRIVTFNPVLRHKMFPLPQILELILDMGTWGMGTPVEIEFALRLSDSTRSAKGIRRPANAPLVVHREEDALSLDDIEDAVAMCKSNRVGPWSD
jgi:hypothetical protein